MGCHRDCRFGAGYQIRIVVGLALAIAVWPGLSALADEEESVSGCLDNTAASPLSLPSRAGHCRWYITITGGLPGVGSPCRAAICYRLA
jgi:hypothetical protein